MYARVTAYTMQSQHENNYMNAILFTCTDTHEIAKNKIAKSRQRAYTEPMGDGLAVRLTNDW